MTTPSKIRQHFWEPWKTMVEYVNRLAGPCARVVEIGPGDVPFAAATEFVDSVYRNDLPKLVPNVRQQHILDICAEPLPFADKSVDFIYCRHTLEDLWNPFLVCREMARVAKAGYIETPSPLAEFSRGIDGGTPPWRGYHHHRYIIWNEHGVLTFLPKLPIIEYVGTTGDLEVQVIDLLNEGPLHWNTYFFWTDSLPFRVLGQDHSFAITRDFPEVLTNGIRCTVEHHQRMQQSSDFRTC